MPLLYITDVSFQENQTQLNSLANSIQMMRIHPTQLKHQFEVKLYD